MTCCCTVAVVLAAFSVFSDLTLTVVDLALAFVVNSDEVVVVANASLSTS